MKFFSRYEIVEDNSGKLLKIKLAKREDGARSYYIINNLDGRFVKSNSRTLHRIISNLNKMLPVSKPNEIIFGFTEGSILLTAALASSRKSNFVCSTRSRRLDIENEIVFIEEHRDKTPTHFIYALEKGNQVILIEDEISTGKTVLNAYKVFKKYGIKIIAVTTLVEILNFQPRQVIKKVTGLDLFSVCKIKLL